MVDEANEETGNHNDDGADLVQEVIEQNPPEEQGIRDEWDGHVGWHRKEDVRGVVGGGLPNAQGNKLRGSHSKAIEKVDHDEQTHQNPKILNNYDGNPDGYKGLLDPLYIGGFLFMVSLLLRFMHPRLRLSRGQKER